MNDTLGGHKMQSYKIISDSSCDLPESLLKELDVGLVPYYVSFDTVQYYKEIQDIKVRDFYEKVVSERLFPKTSLPPIQDYVDIFEKHLKNGNDIVCMCLSGKFSGSFQSAANAKNIVLEDYPERRIEIFDTIQATGGQGLVVYQAAKMKQADYSLDEMLNKLEKLKETARINFTVDSLDHLQHGGRIGKASALAGSLLNIKPIIVMKNGELVPSAKVRGKKKALNTILEMTWNDLKEQKEEFDVCIIAADRMEDAQQLEFILKEKYGISVLKPIFDVGVTIGTHAGPTAIGICYIQKYTFL